LSAATMSSSDGGFASLVITMPGETCCLSPGIAGSPSPLVAAPPQVRERGKRGYCCGSTVARQPVNCPLADLCHMVADVPAVNELNLARQLGWGAVSPTGSPGSFAVLAEVKQVEQIPARRLQLIATSRISLRC